MNKKFDTKPIHPPETFDELRQRIRDQFSDLTPHLKRIAQASLEEPKSFALNTSPVIADELDIQPSTLIRFAKEFGYKGFSDLQRVFRQRLIEGEANVRDAVLAKNATVSELDTKALLEACTKDHQIALKRLLHTCDVEELSKAIQIMRSARHIYIAGLRRSRPVADYLLYALLRGERSASMLDFSGGMAGPQIGTVKEEDVIFAIAFPPYSKPVADAFLDARVSGKRVVALTDGPSSPLAKDPEAALFLETDSASQFQPISGAMALVQTLVTAISRN